MLEDYQEQRVIRGRTAKNLLRAHLGVTGGTGPECPMLSDDPTLPLWLATGAHTVGFDLADLHVISELAFVNDGAKGTIELQVSSNGETWESVFSGDLLPDSRRMRFRFVPVEARFVKLALAIQNPGSLYCVGLFGLTVAADYEVVPRSSEAGLFSLEDLSKEPVQSSKEKSGSESHEPRVSLTITPADALAPWVSSGKELSASEALQLIDENAFTEHEFRADDPAPTVLLDLTEEEPVRKVSVLCRRAKGTLRLRFYRGTEERDAAIRSDGSGRGNDDGDDEAIELTDTEGVGRFTFRRLRANARLVELIWTPAGDASSSPEGAFAINEVAIFSESSLQTVRPRAVIPITSGPPEEEAKSGPQGDSSEPVAVGAPTTSTAEPTPTFDLDLDPASF